MLKPIEPEDLQEVLKRLQKAIQPTDDEEVLDMNTTVIEKIITELQERYTEDISLAALAEKYNISQSNLSTLIKKKLGLSFSEYITARRMKTARELLADENLSIDAIAEAVGYHDYFYFTKVFKKSQGISPSKYRKLL